jgi:probable rRNA maturation factor
MINFTYAKLKEKSLMKRVEKAVFDRLGQDNFFITDVAVVDEDTIREYNRETRGIDSVTDVLSFPYFERMALPVDKDGFGEGDFVKGRVCLGSIMICRKRAEEQAKEYGHSVEREMGFLTCHGFLHILGFDHVVPEDEKVMFPLQEEIMSSIGLERK